jgi:hypothetical protein
MRHHASEPPHKKPAADLLHAVSENQKQQAAASHSIDFDPSRMNVAAPIARDGGDTSVLVSSVKCFCRSTTIARVPPFRPLKPTLCSTGAKKR